jgi:HlyD family secretion protein
MKRWIIVLAVIGIIILGFFAFRALGQSRADQALADLQTETIQVGTLEASVGATGRVRSDQTAILNFETTGTVEQVNTRTGDLVEAGELMASLSQASLPSSVIMAEAELVAAERELDSLLNSGLPAAQAQNELALAQDALEAAERNWSVQQEGNRASSTTVKNAQAELTLAKDALDEAQALYNRISGSVGSDPGKASAFRAVAAAQQRYDSALRSYNWYTGHPDANDQALLDAEVALAQARVNDALREWERLKDGPDAGDIAAAQARVAAAQATLAMAEIRAPFPGTITAVHVMEGDQVSPGSPGFQLDNLGRLLVEVEVSEVDINRIETGQPVVLNFDAILDRAYSGEVVEIDPTGNSVQGVVNFIVTVELLEHDDAVKPGMTAAVTIIVSKIGDVVLVPNRAVRLKDGQRVVYILKDGVPQSVPVQLGASSDLYSEVLNGSLQPGDVVVLNPPAEFEFGGGPPRGFGGRGG